MSQISLNWLIQAHGSTVLAIPGASKLKQAQENIGTLEFTLSNAQLQKLSTISACI